VFAKLLQIFEPPQFEDETQNPPAIVLNAVLLISMGGLLLASLLTTLGNPSSILPIVIYTAVLVSLIPFYILMHTGYIGFVSWALVTVLWCVITAVNYLLGGIEGPAFSSYLVLIVIGALLLGRWGGAGIALLSVLTLVAFYLLRHRIPAPEPHIAPIVKLLLEIAHAILITLFIYIATSTINQFLQRTRTNEDALRQSLQDLRQTTVSKNYVDNIIQSMSNLLIVLNPDGTIRTANLSALEVLGYSEQEIIGQRYHDNIVVKGSTQLDILNNLSNVTQNLMYRDIDQTYKAKDGRLIPVTVSSAAMYDEQNNVQGVVCVAQDVTERQEAAQQLAYQAGLLDAVFDAIIATDMALNIISWNNAAQTIYGYRADEVIGRKLTDIVPTIFSRNESGAEIIKEKYWQNEVIQKRRDGSTLHVLSSISLLRDKSGNPSGTITINHDITKRIEAEIALQELYTQVSNLEQLKTDMIRLASHDLRSPVGIINGYVQLLQADLEDVINAEQMDFIQQIGESATRMDEIATNILSLERIHQLAKSRYDEEVNLAALAQQAYQNHLGAAKEHGLTLSLEVDNPSQPIFVKGDDKQLYEVLVNYVTNAIKYTAQGGHIDIRLAIVREQAHLTVTDTGYGIPQDQQSKLFQAFFRAKSDATTHIDGVGLGLHLVKNIVARHKGKIIFKSVYGEGSTFGFSLPLVSQPTL
jgi:PAS domain S-box-containing protein